MTDSRRTPIPVVIRRLGTPEDQQKQRMVPRLLRGAVTVRYCGPGEYAFRVLGEIALLAVTLAALELLLPVYRLLGLAVWAACGALTALDVTLLRVRLRASRCISPGRRAFYAGIAVAATVTAVLLVVFLVIVPFLNWLGGLPGAAISGYENYSTSVCELFHPPSQCGGP